MRAAQLALVLALMSTLNRISVVFVLAGLQDTASLRRSRKPRAKLEDRTATGRSRVGAASRNNSVRAIACVVAGYLSHHTEILRERCLRGARRDWWPERRGEVTLYAIHLTGWDDRHEGFWHRLLDRAASEDQPRSACDRIGRHLPQLHRACPAAYGNSLMDCAGLVCAGEIASDGWALTIWRSWRLCSLRRSSARCSRR